MTAFTDLLKRETTPEKMTLTSSNLADEFLYSLDSRLSMSALEALEQFVITDGKICWPRVFVYRYKLTDKEIHNFPPPFDETGHGEISYYTIAENQVAMDWLRRSGWLYSPEHTGRISSEIIDNRKAPGS